MASGTIPQSIPTRISDRLLDKWAVEERTSLDITTIYRKIKAGTFPQPVRVGKRRVAWRSIDVDAWEKALVQGVGVSGPYKNRGVAQPGSASALGAEGRRFKSDRPDHPPKGRLVIHIGPVSEQDPDTLKKRKKP